VASDRTHDIAQNDNVLLAGCFIPIGPEAAIGPLNPLSPEMADTVHLRASAITRDQIGVRNGQAIEADDDEQLPSRNRPSALRQ